jgi:micrococcal nuclease
MDSTAIVRRMRRLASVLGLAAAMMFPTIAIARDHKDTGRIAWVTDGDTFRLESGERIRIARIDAPETLRDQAKCSAEIELGLRAKDRATSLLTGRDVTFRGIGRSYDRTVATVMLDGRDLGSELVRMGVAAWWPRGRPKPDWCPRQR